MPFYPYHPHEDLKDKLDEEYIDANKNGKYDKGEDLSLILVLTFGHFFFYLLSGLEAENRYWQRTKKKYIKCARRT